MINPYLRDVVVIGALFFMYSKISGYANIKDKTIHDVKKGTFGYYHEKRHIWQSDNWKWVLFVMKDLWAISSVLSLTLWSWGFRNSSFWVLSGFPSIIFWMPVLFLELDANVYAFRKKMKQSKTKC